jgi:hypothetical protein
MHLFRRDRSELGPGIVLGRVCKDGQRLRHRMYSQLISMGNGKGIDIGTGALSNLTATRSWRTALYAAVAGKPRRADSRVPPTCPPKLQRRRKPWRRRKRRPPANLALPVEPKTENSKLETVNPSVHIRRICTEAFPSSWPYFSWLVVAPIDIVAMEGAQPRPGRAKQPSNFWGAVVFG